MTEIEKIAEQAAIEILTRSGWLKWHDFGITYKYQMELGVAKTVVDPLHIDYSRVFWYEGLDQHVRPVMISPTSIMGQNYLHCEDDRRNVWKVPMRTYGTEWRLWTQRPTDQQIEMTPFVWR